MTRVVSEISIDAAPDKVWEVLADIGSIQNFHAGVSRSYRTTELPGGVGAQRVCEFPHGGSIVERVVEWKEGESMRIAILEGHKMPPFADATGGFRVQRQGHFTQVQMFLEYRLKYGLLGKLLNVVMVRRQFERVVPLVLAGLKRHVETGELIETGASPELRVVSSAA